MPLCKNTHFPVQFKTEFWRHSDIKQQQKVLSDVCVFGISVCLSTRATQSGTIHLDINDVEIGQKIETTFCSTITLVMNVDYNAWSTLYYFPNSENTISS